MKWLPSLDLIPVLLGGCTLMAADTRPASQTASQPSLQPIRYERNGGFAGTHDVVEIDKNGDVVVVGKLLESGKAKLTADQAAKLAGLLANWKSLKANYPAPAGTADVFEYKIRYGSVEVAASGANRDVPDAFVQARQAIEEIAQGVQAR